jgi:molybdenum cofactor cytidylyltransferase
MQDKQAVKDRTIGCGTVSSTVNISAVIMASGMSARMGEDKLHLKLGSKYLYEHILDTVWLYPFYEVLVAAKDDDILAKARSQGFQAVRNTRYSMGQSESIKAALIISRPTDGYMFFAADQPFVQLETIKLLCSKFAVNPNRIIVPVYGAKRGSPVIFPCSFQEQLLGLKGDQGGRVLLQSHMDRVTGVQVLSDWENIDIDTREDYKLVKKIRIDSRPVK